MYVYVCICVSVCLAGVTGLHRNIVQQDIWILSHCKWSLLRAEETTRPPTTWLSTAAMEILFMAMACPGVTGVPGVQDAQEGCVDSESKWRGHKARVMTLP